LPLAASEVFPKVNLCAMPHGAVQGANAKIRGNVLKLSNPLKNYEKMCREEKCKKTES
jgi:hypothetical protein